MMTSDVLCVWYVRGSVIKTTTEKLLLHRFIVYYFFVVPIFGTRSSGFCHCLLNNNINSIVITIILFAIRNVSIITVSIYAYECRTTIAAVCLASRRSRGLVHTLKKKKILEKQRS